MFIDNVAAIPAAERTDTFAQSVDAVPAIPRIEAEQGEQKINEEEAFRKVFEYFFAGIINRAMGSDDSDGLAGNSLANEHVTRLYSQEMAQSLISEVNFKNLIAARSFNK